MYALEQESYTFLRAHTFTPLPFTIPLVRAFSASTDAYNATLKHSTSSHRATSSVWPRRGTRAPRWRRSKQINGEGSM